MTRGEALAAILGELDPGLTNEYAVNAPDLFEYMIELVADGACTAAAAAEAMTVANELADATVAGDINPSQGAELMTRLGLRQTGGLDSD